MPADNFTPEQAAAVAARGKIIVSASAGSGKTRVMIAKIADYLQNGGSLDNVLAVTFTKKAAAQMKAKLREELVSRLKGAQGECRENIKAQLGKIPSAEVSTIHSFCSHLVKTYFYALGIDSDFDIIADGDSEATALKYRAIDGLFERLYSEGDADFLYALERLRKKRSDDSLKRLILEGCTQVRVYPRYADKLKSAAELYTDSGFDRVCAEIHSFACVRCKSLSQSVKDFAAEFRPSGNAVKYAAIFEEMLSAFESIINNEDIFAGKPPLHSTLKPRAKADDAADEAFKAFRDDVKNSYDKIYAELSDRESERAAFFESGKLAVAFCRLVEMFDAEYTTIKREENKLDYNDLEQLALRLLTEEKDIRNIVTDKYKCVFVDEYQDVNQIQDEIIKALGAPDEFTVGDVKQAIYGFRGSNSRFFSNSFNRLVKQGGGHVLPDNFRSSAGVINFVNALFKNIMRPPVCDFDYSQNHAMCGGALYPRDYSGQTKICIFGKQQKRTHKAEGVYSVCENRAESTGFTREGLAVLGIVKQALKGKHFDLKSKSYVPTQTGDICILTRKHGGASVSGIMRALTAAGYEVGGEEGNLCDYPEVRQLLDILSYIDNSQQDIPLVTALLSPLGGLCEEELARIRLFGGTKRPAPVFRKCALEYAKRGGDGLAEKLRAFFGKMTGYRRLSDAIGAGWLIEKIMADSGLSAAYSSGGGAKLARIRRLSREAYSPSGELYLNAFLAKLKAGGYFIPSPPSAEADSIKIMTMHASKGLEFPVVIIADICASFKGGDVGDMPFDGEYLFAPRYYDEKTRLRRRTVLRSLLKMRADSEDLKNELNLFYVACTRAQCSLYVMAEEALPYFAPHVFDCSCYAQLFDISEFSPETVEPEPINAESGLKVKIDLSRRDEALYNGIAKVYNGVYPHADSMQLPVKSSASQLLRLRDGTDFYYAENKLFNEGEQAETGTQRGTAYHRFLELCDFSVKDAEGVKRQLDAFLSKGLISAEQYDMLSPEELCSILAIPVFDRVRGAEFYREKEFLCKLPANLFLDTSAEDGVLVQGAIDLLVFSKSGTHIIDYKYSKLADEKLKEHYSPQLSLYKKAVSRISGVREESISATIVNLFLKREINLT